MHLVQQDDALVIEQSELVGDEPAVADQHDLTARGDDLPRPPTPQAAEVGPCPDRSFVVVEHGDVPDGGVGGRARIHRAVWPQVLPAQLMILGIEHPPPPGVAVVDVELMSARYGWDLDRVEVLEPALAEVFVQVDDAAVRQQQTVVMQARADRVVRRHGVVGDDRHLDVRMSCEQPVTQHGHTSLTTCADANIADDGVIGAAGHRGRRHR